MAKLNKTRFIDKQTLIYEEIDWEETARFSPLGPASGVPPVEVRGAPPGVRSAMTSDDSDYTPDEARRPPYWEFDYGLHETSGLRFTNVVVRDAISSGSSDNVFESIEFADLGIEFTDGTKVDFDMAAALASPSALLLVSAGGTRNTVTPNDSLFQRGLKLKLTQNVLAASGGSLNVTVRISAVFRGAANDFDPGGVPVALDLWPQIGLTWERGSKTVARMRGSVKLLATNAMSHWPDAPMSTHENVASFFTDCNASLPVGRALASGIRPLFGSFGGRPFGWSMVFDYLLGNVTTEKELVGVYGPRDGNKYTQSTSAPRSRPYPHPPASVFTIRVAKHDRQGDYDNIHTHSKMPMDACGNVPIHAPFCGHSCVHLHWRWAGLSADAAEGDRGWQFKGWEKSARITSRYSAVVRASAHALAGAPLIPPNQRLQFALCRPAATRHSADHIINPAAPAALDPLRKLYWYCVDVMAPHLEQQQVLFEHGIGWAYRYALPAESAALGNFFGLTLAIEDDLPWSGTPTQIQMMGFFEEVYHLFRYRGACVDDIPQGTYNAGSGTTMEDL